MSRKNVYITGMGLCSSLGNDPVTFFEGLKQGRSAIRQYPDWRNYNGLFSHLGAPVPEYDIKKIPRSARRTMSRMSEMATLATIDALGQADLRLGQGVFSPRALLCMGSTTGSPETMETYFKKLFDRGGPEGQMGTTFFKVMNHSVPANVAAAIDFRGPVFSVSSACATSTHALSLGWELIQSGAYDVVIAGGADELHYTSAAVFDVVLAASRNFNDQPDRASRPFDQARDGLVVSEGASVVVLESEESVRARRARPIARLLGGAYLCNGAHMSQSDSTIMVEVMRMALDRAGLNPGDVGYVNAHATGTIQGDQEEAEAIGQVFGKTIPVSSLKGHLGHSLAACGGIEVIASIKMMEEQLLIKTRNLDNVDPACNHVAHIRENISTRVSAVLSNNFAFGGMNTSLVISLEGRDRVTA